MRYTKPTYATLWGLKMGIRENGNFVHWNYFIAIEQDLSKISRFIEFTETNFDTYSIELAHLLLAASSEVDVVLKALCNMKNPDKNHHNINDYKETVKSKLSELVDEKVFIRRYGLELVPWTDWNGDDNPLWWGSYNKVKHQRDEYFGEANLKNTLNSIAALSVVVLYYYREVFNQENAHTFRDVVSRLAPETTLIGFDRDYSHVFLVVPQKN